MKKIEWYFNRQHGIMLVILALTAFASGLINASPQAYLEVADYTALKALDSSQLDNGDLIFVSGQAQPFMFSDTTITADNAVVFALTDGNGMAVRLYEDAVYLSWYDGTVTSVVMTNLLSIYKKIVVDTSFTATSQITLSDGNILQWAYDARITWTFSDNLLIGADDIKILAPIATGPEAKFFLECQYGNQNIIIRDAVITDACLITTGAPSGGYDNASLSGLTKNVVIDNSHGIRTTASGNRPFIHLSYVDGVQVNGGSAANYWYGITYWGGDSNPAKDGVRENPRLARNIVVNSFNADGTIHAGLWGSMGDCIRFVNCTARRAAVGGDVGIDHEGSLNVKNIGCTAENWANGNYSCFWRCEDISFIDCNSYQPGGYPHYRNYNASDNYIRGGDISFIGGVMQTTDLATSGVPATIDNANGAARSMLMSKTTLIDSVINLSKNNQGAVSIDVDAKWTAAPQNAQVTCYVRANSSSKLNYQVSVRVLLSSGVTMPAESYAVKCSTTSYNYSHTMRISECKDAGLGIHLVEGGGNSGISGKFLVYNNLVTSLTKDDDGAKAMKIVRQDNNYNDSGNLVTF